MRCFLMRDGHIRDVEVLPTHLSDQEAIEQCRLAFERQREAFDDFEVWHLARKIYQHSRGDGDAREASAIGLANLLAEIAEATTQASEAWWRKVARLLGRER